MAWGRIDAELHKLGVGLPPLSAARPRADAKE
jgi:hypothetical protein